MNILRAVSRTYKNGWWELKLLDLSIVADGETEEAMLKDVAYRLCAEYHLAVKFGKPPFVDLVLSCSSSSDEQWNDDHKKFNSLGLPKEVSQALATALRRKSLNDFKVVEYTSAA